MFSAALPLAETASLNRDRPKARRPSALPPMVETASGAVVFSATVLSVAVFLWVPQETIARAARANINFFITYCLLAILPYSGSTFTSDVTATVARQQIITIQKNIV